MSQSFADPPYLIMVRINCEFLYQKSLMVLHRKYMSQEGNETSETSTRTCIAAAIAIVRWFADLHEEFKPGGQLHHERWMLSSFTMNDFLLAAMILCLAVSKWRKKNQNAGRNIRGDWEAKEWFDMLVRSHDMCVEEAEKGSKEGRKVAEALNVMLVALVPDVRLKSLARTSPKSPERPEASSREDASMDYSYTASSHSNDAAASSSASTSFSNPSTARQQSIQSPLSQNQQHVQPQPDANAFAFNPTDDPFYPFLSPTTQPANIDWAALDTFLAHPGNDIAAVAPVLDTGFGSFHGEFAGFQGGLNMSAGASTTNGGGATTDLENGLNNLNLPYSGYRFAQQQQPTRNQAEQPAATSTRRNMTSSTTATFPHPDLAATPTGDTPTASSSTSLTAPPNNNPSTATSTWTSQPLPYFGGPDGWVDGQWRLDTPTGMEFAKAEMRRKTREEAWEAAQGPAGPKGERTHQVAEIEKDGWE
ncbi:uncharacterized protein AB675_11359 [Cyphellophora attinorum]|uniref:Transcription factor domain-containing protein n=1 Tax=Cyphellophora attinorum TaxID=1664694 RepID=A0A0N1HAZ6_9EURO|nr:uncharacterized protein AB675_11359 [Phialophora attinorum]KPI40104.1 hypothetical protein AB675_11359 [Phialophora attinorum]